MQELDGLKDAIVNTCEKLYRACETNDNTSLCAAYTELIEQVGGQ